MVKPIILTLDDEPLVLNAIERDLRQHYHAGYRIVKSNSAAEALQTLRAFKLRSQPVALFLVDQRMPKMSGIEFLLEARRIYPQARKVLLTAYADTEAAISSINRVELDHYLMKPWDPPEENLYPVLDDLLSDWTSIVPQEYDGIRVAGTLWSAKCHTAKDFLSRNHIPYRWLDVEIDASASAMVDSLTGGQGRFPVVFFPDGSVLVEPDNRSLADKVGLQTQASLPFYDLIIIGAGPAGLAAGVYGASEGLRTVMIEREAPGGQAGTSSRIENYLGFPNGLSGADLARRATAQAERLGAEILKAQEVVHVRTDDPYRVVTLGDGTELNCKALVIATGVSVRQLQIPGIEHLSGAGVYYGAALSEAAYYRGEHVFVIGGANSAGQGAMFFARYASKVTMILRSSNLEERMSRYLVDQIKATGNIEIMTGKEVVGVRGAKHLQAITYRDITTGEQQTAPTPAMFIFIGATANTDYLDGILQRDEAGFILTGPGLASNGNRPKSWPLQRDPYLLETCVPGIFAAGDVRCGAVRRVASAVGEGATAISFVHQYLKTV